jgi:signal transduction histidine kinase
MSEPSPDPDPNLYLRTHFLERVAHELRGPAGVTLGALAEIETALGDAAKEYRPLLAMARRGVQRIVRTAERLDQTGQLESKVVEFTSDVCDLRAVLLTATRDADALEARRKITLTTAVSEGEWLAYGDARWLGSALLELCSNAIRHAKTTVKVSAERDDAGVTLRFWDDGAPAPPIAPRRFQDMEERRGLGLGLAIAKDVIEAHGGRLSTEQAEQGSGITIEVHFPNTMMASRREIACAE